MTGFCRSLFSTTRACPLLSPSSSSSLASFSSPPPVSHKPSQFRLFSALFASHPKLLFSTMAAAAAAAAPSPSSFTLAVPASRAEAISALLHVVSNNGHFKTRMGAAPHETQQLLDQFLTRLQQPPPDCSDISARMIVVEGLDGTGKSTLTSSLRAHPHCLALQRTPPPEYAALRPIFDDCVEGDRRAFYFAANYVASDIAADLLKEAGTPAHGFLLFDRYYYSTIAYNLAHKHTFETLPPAGHAVYRWPVDLFPRPSHIIVLVASEETRVKRIQARADTETVAITEEEERLRKSLEFRQLVTEAYRRCEGVVEVSADGTPEEVLAGVKRAIALDA